jgi:hypothetical protein
MVALGLALTLAGCAGEPYVAPGAQPAAAKMTAQPVSPVPLGRRVSTLLDFETGNDLTFVATQPVAEGARIDTAIARTGARCMVLAGGATSVSIKTPTLLQGRPFPADWVLLGAFVLTDRPVTATASYDTLGKPTLTRTLAIAPGIWTPVMIDLTSLGGGTGIDAGVLRFDFSSPGGGGGAATIRLDDVVLVDNQETLIDTAAATSAGGWRVERRGLNYLVNAPGRFGFALPTSQAQATGWTAVESCEKRVRFASPAAPGSLTIYSDGRMYFGGDFRPAWRDMKDAAEQAAQHAAPADVSIPDSMGRLNRSTPGDADNDGYNESLGAYQVVARGDRIEMTLSPRSAPLSRPVVQIAGLPPGSLRVTVDGTLVPGAVRVPSSGDVLIEVPSEQIVRPVLVNVRVQ